jgi:hypothetical protein
MNYGKRYLSLQNIESMQDLLNTFGVCEINNVVEFTCSHAAKCKSRVFFGRKRKTTIKVGMQKHFLKYIKKIPVNFQILNTVLNTLPQRVYNKNNIKVVTITPEVLNTKASKGTVHLVKR